MTPRSIPKDLPDPHLPHDPKTLQFGPIHLRQFTNDGNQLRSAGNVISMELQHVGKLRLLDLRKTSGPWIDRHALLLPHSHSTKKLTKSKA